MLNPEMKSWGFYELTRQKAEQLRTEQRGKPQPTENRVGPWLDGMPRREQQIELNCGVPCAEGYARCPRAAPLVRRDNRVPSSRGTEGSNPSPSAAKSVSVVNAAALGEKDSERSCFGFNRVENQITERPLHQRAA
jgi:hypothetical protein